MWILAVSLIHAHTYPALLEFKTTIIRLMQCITIEDPGKESNNCGGFIQGVTCYPKHMTAYNGFK